jgi:hypothetical protein
VVSEERKFSAGTSQGRLFFERATEAEEAEEEEGRVEALENREVVVRL